MKRIVFAGLALVTLAVLFLVIVQQRAPEGPENWPVTGRPNILLIVADDQRWDQLGVVQQEQGDKARFPFLETPRLDAFAREGVRFRNAFVTTSLCSPSRASTLTGHYAHRHGVIDNHTPFPYDRTFATELREAGYTTAYFGKWHHGQQAERPGFECYATYVGQGRYYETPFLVNKDFPRCGDTSSKPVKTVGYVDDESIDFLLEYLGRPQNKPFAVMLGLKGVHEPFIAKAAHIDSYRHEELAAPDNWATAVPWTIRPREEPHPPRTRAIWLQSLETMRSVDHSVGRVLDALDGRGLADTTLVIFTSDNGYYFGEHRLGDKRSAYEESMRVPLLLRYPRAIAAGTVRDELALNIDLAPTMLDFAGLAAPQDAQGLSLKSLLAADGGEWREDFLYEFWRQPAIDAPDGRKLTAQVRDIFGTPTMLSVRTAQHKLTAYRNRPEYLQLFDLSADPYETRNLAQSPEYAALREEMCGRLKRLMVETDYSFARPFSRWLAESSYPDKADSMYGSMDLAGDEAQFSPEC